jgi:hypothetical protein
MPPQPSMKASVALPVRCAPALSCGGCLLQLQIATQAAVHAVAARPHQVQRRGIRATMGILSAYVIYRHADIDEETRWVRV